MSDDNAQRSLEHSINFASAYLGMCECGLDSVCGCAGNIMSRNLMNIVFMACNIRP